MWRLYWLICPRLFCGRVSQQIQWRQHSFHLIYRKDAAKFDLDSSEGDYAILVKSMHVSWCSIILSRRPLWLMKCWYLIHGVDGRDKYAGLYAWEGRTIVCVCLCVLRNTKAVFTVLRCSQADPQMVSEWHAYPREPMSLQCNGAKLDTVILCVSVSQYMSWESNDIKTTMLSCSLFCLHVSNAHGSC